MPRKVIRTLIAITSSLSLFASDCGASEREEFERANRKVVTEVKKRLRALHAGLTAYMKNSGGVWPQPPKKAFEDSEFFLKWWQDALEPHGVPKELWVWEGGEIGFVPTGFGKEPLKAFKWSTQPWVMAAFLIGEEEAAYMILPDGKIWVMPFDEHLAPKAGEGKKIPPAKVPDDLRR